MKIKFVEVTNGERNWGKFLLGRFSDEWEYRSAISKSSFLLQEVGWTPAHLLVLDIQTGEGAIFRPGGLAEYDLNKHKIWVCPMYEPFLEWLYKQDLSDLDKLPAMLDLEDAPFAMYGYRRPGEKDMDSDDLREIQDKTGVPYMSLYAIRIQIRQFKAAGFPIKQIVRNMEILHPQLMPNLKIQLPEKISLRDESLVWVRRQGWARR